VDAGDYWRMFRAKGWRLPVWTFRQVHLFDLRRGTDTAARVLKPAFDMPPEEIEHGTDYWATWTSLVDDWYDWTADRLGPAFGSTTLVDLGCGKGKVLLRWLERARDDGLPLRAVGVEYYRPLLDVARANLSRLALADRCTLLCADASTVEPDAFGEHPVIYLYNPFDGEVLRRVLERLRGRDVLVIYANPVHTDVLESMGYLCVHETSGWHTNQWARAYVPAG
jgi:SAM-dependent methyltransferase